MSEHDNPEPDVPTCVDCGLTAPPGDEETPLISIKHRWRLSRAPGDYTPQRVVWRCPTCWAKHKEEFGIKTDPRLTDHRGLTKK